MTKKKEAPEEPKAVEAKEDKEASKEPQAELEMRHGLLVPKKLRKGA